MPKMNWVLKPNESLVERSLCCHAPITFGVRRRGTYLDPDEYDDVCLECGNFCEAAEFIRDDENGTLIDLETGERIEEGHDLTSDDEPDFDLYGDR